MSIVFSIHLFKMFQQNSVNVPFLALVTGKSR